MVARACSGCLERFRVGGRLLWEYRGLAGPDLPSRSRRDLRAQALTTGWSLGLRPSAFRAFWPYNGVLRRSVSLRSFLRLSAHIQLMPVLESGEETLVGGQAVIEGVMMRAPHSYCVAVRKPSGEVVTHEMPVPRMSEKYKIFKYPVLRGLGVLGQAMSLGIKALRFSANTALDDGKSGQKTKEISSWGLAFNLIFSFAFFVFLYKLVPLYLVTSLEKWYPALHGRIAFNAADRV